MNKTKYRLVYSKLRGMLVAVEETAAGTGKATERTKGSRERSDAYRLTRAHLVRLPVSVKHIALAALTLGSALSLHVHAQVVSDPNGGAHRPTVIQTANGIQQVNITRPSAAGVSQNAYTQFDVPKAGVVLNNSSTIVNTQQAGFINGNPNFAAGQSAKIILNQVNSNSPSQLRGFIEVAGSKAEVVVANGSGIVVDGGGFINTTRGILTTGTPVIDSNGALTGFNVTGGLISVQGAGLNATNVDQVDLIARAVQANAAIYGNNLNVVAGASHVDHDTLAATPITGDGPAPSIAIDVSQLGGMYANRIFLVSNEYGVGVSNAGVLAAQAGDLTLTAQGQLVLSGHTNASGNLSLTAAGGIENTGTAYAQQNASINTVADLTNTGTLAAQQNTTIHAGNLNSTGTLGAGINSDSSTATSGDLTLSASGVLSATGHNTAGGNLSLYGASLNLSGSQTSANGKVALNAGSGNIDLTGATTTAGSSLLASAQGTLVNDHGVLSSTGAQSITAGAVSNQAGQIVSQSTLDILSAGALANHQGIMQAAAREQISAASLDNSAGRIVSLNADGLRIATSGTLVNATGTTGNGAMGGVIGTGGALDMAAGSISNQAQISSNADAIVQAQSLDNHAGSIVAGTNLGTTIGSALDNENGILSSSATTVSAATIDNSNGTIEGDRLGVSATGTLVNRGGHISQYGSTAQTLSAGGALDNTGGTIASNATSLSIAAQSLANDSGAIQHAGTGTLDVSTTGGFSNTGGAVITNGALDVTGGAVSNQGQISAKGDASINASALDNHAGSIVAGGNLGASIAGVLGNQSGTLSGSATTVSAASADNTGGLIEGDELALTTTGNLVNQGGAIRQYSSSDQTLAVGGTLNNTSGTIGSNASNLTVSADTLTNDNGSIEHAGTGTLELHAISAMSNTGGAAVTNGSLNVDGGAISNQGQLASGANAAVHAQSFDNHAGSTIAAGSLDVTVAGALGNQSGTLSGSATTVSAASADNSGGTIEGDQLALSTTGDLINRNSGSIRQYGSEDQTVTAGGTFDNTGGLLASNASTLTLSAQALANDSGSIQHAGAGTLAITTQNALSNTSGQISTNGALDAQAANLDNTNGTLSAQGAETVDASAALINHGGTLYGKTGLTASTLGALDNSSGTAQTSGDLSLTARGALSNANGSISANGESGTLAVTGSSIDNTSGRLVNAGSGTTTVTSFAGITNTSGTLGGNGDVTLSAQTLTNTAGAQLVAAGNANLNVTASVNNAGGTIYGGSALNLNQSGAVVTNNAGQIEGGQDVSLRAAALSNAGGAIRANRDIAAAGAVSGDGAMIAGRNLSLSVTGDYANDAANQLHADGTLSVSATGTLTNSGTLAAGTAVSATGANVVNTAGADINSATTTVNASNTLTNVGRIEGDSVTTNSATLANTGTVIGNSVQVNATDVQNSGAAAVIAGAQSVKIYASNSITNADGALIYSAGNLELARDGTRDGSGLLADETGILTNSAASIQAAGNIDIAAQTVNNLRTGVVTVAGTPQNTGTTTLTLWTAGIGPTGDDIGFYQSALYPQWSWDDGGIGAGVIGHLAHPITVTVPKSQVTNLNVGNQSFSLTQPLTDSYGDLGTPVDGPLRTRTITNNATQYYNSITDNGTTYTITLWPDWNPNTNIRPDQVTVRTDLGPDNHDYVELSRTTTTTTATDQLVSAGTAATIQAQGTIRINADGGNINNNSSTMAAGGDLIRRATGGTVNDTGTVLQQTVTTDTDSTFFWHQKTGGSSDTKQVDDGITQSTTTVGALPAIATAGGAVQTNGETINIGSVNLVGQTVIGSGVTGGNATGTQLGSVSGQTATAGTASEATGHAGAASSAASAGSTTVRPQTLGSASSGIPNLTLPANGLFSLQTAPSATYLVATDPRFTTYSNFVSSDYMLGQLGLNPQTTEKRVGDGSYEEQLVMQQVTQLTGQTFLAGYSDNMDEYTALMNNGVTYAKDFDLTPGIGLTDTQMQQLTTDMVWLVSQTVTLPDGTQQTVLVPKLYLAQGDTVDLQDTGAIVSGNSVSLTASGNVNNSGQIVSNVATTVIGDNIVNSGVIGSAGTTAVAAVQDVTNVSGRIGGANTVVQAGRDVIDSTATASVSNTLQQNGFSSSASSQSALATGTISGTGNVMVLAGRDVDLTGAAISAGNSALVAAGRDINVGTTTLTTTQDAGTSDGLNGGHDSVTTNVGSTITTGGNFTSVSGGNTTLTDTSVKSGGDATVIAGNNLTVTAATDSKSHSEQSLGGPEAKHTASSYDEATQGSDLNASNNLTLGAGQTATAAALLSNAGINVAADAATGGGNLSVLGSSVTTGTVAADGSVSGGATKLAATGDITVGSVNETHDSQSWQHIEHSGLMSSDKTTDQKTSHNVDAVGSTISGDTVSATAGHDLTIAGSTVASTNDLTLSAGHDLKITTTQSTSDNSTFHEETKSGFGGTGGAGISYGNTDTKDTTHDNSVTQNGSLVGSTDGSVTMVAGNDLHITGSDVIAAQDVTGVAANVIIDSAASTSHHDETQETKTSGFTLGLGGSVGDAINNAIQQAQAASSGAGDGRAKALHGIAAAGDAASALMGAPNVGSSPGAPSISVQLSFGSSQSKNTFTEDQTTQTGSGIKAGGTTSFTATGNGTPGSGNLTIAGSDVSGNDVALTAKNQVNLLNSTDTDSTRSTNESSSASVGVSYGTQGWGVSASMSNAHGDSNSDAAMQNNSHVTAANNVSIVSGGDTNIVGADVSGNHVAVDVSGNLNIQSVQDTTVSAAHQSSTSGGFSLSQGGGSASFSSQHGSASGNYAAVNEQAGIQAGSGGFDINVKGNTNLTGAYIASDADASKNSLTTGALTVSDIQDHSDYNASSSGFGVGYGFGSTGKAVGPGSVPGSGGVTPMLSQHDSDNSSATTQSAIGAGAINITDAANQMQDVASINRDTSGLNGSVSKLPDVNNLLSQQADMMNASQAAGQTVAQGIGAYADNKRETATDAATAAAWAEGGDNRALLQAAGGALIGGLGGGSIFTAVEGAAGAGLASKAAKGLADVANGVDSATGSQLIGNLAANVAAGLGGALIGGTVGAAAASNVHLYNQSLDDEAQLTGESGSGKPFSQTSLGLVLQSVVNGVNAILGVAGGEPPTPSAGGVLVNSAGQTANSMLGAGASAPDTAILNSGKGGGNSSSDGSVSSAGSGSSNSVTSPNSAMRTNANSSGTYVDPLTGNVVPANGALAADHIVPQSWIKQQPGFDQLTPAQQSALLNDPMNTQGLPTTFNSSKGAQMPGAWTTYKGLPLDPGYIQNGATQATNLQSYIQSQIKLMLGK